MVHNGGGSRTAEDEIQADHLSGKPGNVRDFTKLGNCQGKVAKTVYC